jgi:hypothetical protein
VANKIAEAHVAGETSVQLDSKEVACLYRSLSVGAQQYARRGGISNLWESVRNLKNDVQELR